MSVLISLIRVLLMLILLLLLFGSSKISKDR